MNSTPTVAPLSPTKTSPTPLNHINSSLHQIQQLHALAIKSNLQTQLPTLTKLITQLTANPNPSSLQYAHQLFDQIPQPPVLLYNTLARGYSRSHAPSVAFSLFAHMLSSNLSPDNYTFPSILKSCANAKSLEPGKQSHALAVKLVDLLARAGKLDEAYEFIDGLPIKPTPILWRTLLSACGGHGDVELGKVVFERILELDDSHGGDYVILSNMCANANRWDDVNEIRKMMGEKKIVKVPGVSSIEMKNGVHEFFSGDGKHPVAREVHRMVDEVMDRLKAAGYLLDTSKVVHLGLDEEGKEISLRYHSEKLAIAFGLLNSPPGSTIRVVKNLRVCRDCHSMAKMVAKVFGRKIVLRDLNRFHHFEDGVCSCGDYW